MQPTHEQIQKAVIKSQHCQRNWDTSKTIPSDDLDIIIHSATECPSKQNIAYYDAYFITNRDIIEQIHANTVGFYIDGKHRTNSQVLANLLVVFTDKKIEDVADTVASEDFHRNEQADMLVKDRTIEPIIERDVNMAIGIAAGYVNLTATLLGYSTGCCACFNGIEIQKILNVNTVRLLMGVGFADNTRPRREHHKDSTLIFPTLKKQKINYKIVK